MSKLNEVADHPIEDVYGMEILPGDVYWVIGKDIVNDMSLATYLIEHLQVPCFKAQE